MLVVSLLKLTYPIDKPEEAGTSVRGLVCCTAAVFTRPVEMKGSPVAPSGVDMMNPVYAIVSLAHLAAWLVALVYGGMVLADNHVGLEDAIVAFPFYSTLIAAVCATLAAAFSFTDQMESIQQTLSYIAFISSGVAGASGIVLLADAISLRHLQMSDATTTPAFTSDMLYNVQVQVISLVVAVSILTRHMMVEATSHSQKVSDGGMA